jgi:hypothetical protein
MNMEIAGHEFFDVDGKTIWYDLQTPRGEVFWLGAAAPDGKRRWYHVDRDQWSVHFNISPDGRLFAGDGGDEEMVAHARDGKWLYLFTPQAIPDVAGISAPNADDLVHPGTLLPERLVDMKTGDERLALELGMERRDELVRFLLGVEGPRRRSRAILEYNDDSPLTSVEVRSIDSCASPPGHRPSSLMASTRAMASSRICARESVTHHPWYPPFAGTAPLLESGCTPCTDDYCLGTCKCSVRRRGVLMGSESSWRCGC